MPNLYHLLISNFKGIKLIDVDLEAFGNHVTVVGKNDAGKSSFLDAIQWLFGGAKFAPEKPIRNGTEVCQVMGRLDNGLVFKRRKTATTEKFTIESEDGMIYKSPQDVSNALWSPIAFEPDAFSRMDGKKQAAMLRQITGVDTTDLDSRRKKIYEKRTKVNTEFETLQAQAEGIVIPVPPAAIGEEIDIAAVAEERAEIVRQKTLYDKAIAALQDANTAVDKQTADVKKIEDSLAKMKLRLEDLNLLATKAKDEVDAMPELKDTAELDDKIAKAKTHNALVRGHIQQQNEHERVKEQKVKAEAATKRKGDEADALSEEIIAIDKEKAELLAKAKFPVEGMSVDGDDIFVKGVPLSQIASSEQTRVNLAMAMSQKSMQAAKAIKICLIRDADRIGDEKRAVIRQWATENGVTIFEERVERPGVVGLEIVDGHLAGAIMPEDVEAAAAEIAKQEPKDVVANDGGQPEEEPPA